MSRPSWFQRFLLPGFAFKAVVIGGGYATGRNWRSSSCLGRPARDGFRSAAIQPDLRHHFSVRALDREYPQIGAEVLPADFMLRELGLPLLLAAFQLMVFMALLQSAVSCVHAINQRIAGYLTERHQRDFSPVARFACTAALLFVAMVAAQRFGLVDLIAKGYRLLAWMFFITYVLPLMTFGLWRLAKGRVTLATTS